MCFFLERDWNFKASLWSQQCFGGRLVFAESLTKAAALPDSWLYCVLTLWQKKKKNLKWNSAITPFLVTKSQLLRKIHWPVSYQSCLSSVFIGTWEKKYFQKGTVDREVSGLSYRSVLLCQFLMVLFHLTKRSLSFETQCLLYTSSLIF